MLTVASDTGVSVAERGAARVITGAIAAMTMAAAIVSRAAGRSLRLLRMAVTAGRGGAWIGL